MDRGDRAVVRIVGLACPAQGSLEVRTIPCDTLSTLDRGFSRPPDAASGRTHPVDVKRKQLPHVKKDPKNGPGEEKPGNIDKVRDILFGGQMRDYDRRFSRFEERLAQEIAELKEDTRKRLAALEQFVKQETASLGDRIKAEHDERTGAAKDLGREMRESAKAVEKKHGQLDDQIDKLQRELRKQILELHKRLTDDMEGKIADVTARLNQESGDLRNDKTDRAMLAALLNEMALRLSDEPPAAGADNGRKG
ncbi:MAG: hypothetical protein ABIP53_02525 [Candidatus Limnocylindrales bacterium]